jgi:low affinity Fe/Cu permease
MAHDSPTSPAEVTEQTTWFDRFADTMSRVSAQPPFFLVCVGFALAWAVTGPFVKFTHGWVDVLDVVATLVTFSLVALLQNEGWRGNKATQRKLNAIASALAELMEHSHVNPEEVRQLNAAVGLEKRESSSQ